MDTEVARAARSGDDGAFALLIQQNMAGMRAVAIAMLGYVTEAEDVVQDAVLIALRRLPELREPDAAGAWLRSIVRNNCRMLLRSRRTFPVAEPEPLLPVDPRFDPETALEQAATRDWVHHAVAALPEPVRETVLLRYFSDFSSYRQIAELCAVPEHTVRSRLRDGRRALGRVLQNAASAAHADYATQAVAAREDAAAAIQTGSQGLRGPIWDRFHPDAPVARSGQESGTMSAMVPEMDDTLSAGVSLQLLDAVVSRDVMVWEIAFRNPPDDPQHCPPAMAWLHTVRQGRTQRLRIAYRPPEL